MMWLTTMSPETRRLVRVTAEDVEATEIMFNTLLGDDLQSRKQFIEKNGHLYIEGVDVG